MEENRDKTIKKNHYDVALITSKWRLNWTRTQRKQRKIFLERGRKVKH